jgi:hypothetical protein
VGFFTYAENDSPGNADRRIIQHTLKITYLLPPAASLVRLTVDVMPLTHLFPQFLQQRLGLLQVLGVKPLGEPVVDLRQHLPRFAPFVQRSLR